SFWPRRSSGCGRCRRPSAPPPATPSFRESQEARVPGEQERKQAELERQEDHRRPAGVALDDPAGDARGAGEEDGDAHDAESVLARLEVVERPGGERAEAGPAGADGAQV